MINILSRFALVFAVAFGGLAYSASTPDAHAASDSSELSLDSNDSN